MKDPVPACRRIFTVITSATVLSLSLWVSPTLAQDPFRATNERKIGDKQTAFQAIFKGNYTDAERYATSGSEWANDPLAYAMKASLTYTNKDLNSFNSYGQKTLAAAVDGKDPLRGFIRCCGSFLTRCCCSDSWRYCKGTPQALAELRQVYEYMDRAGNFLYRSRLNLLRVTWI